MRDGVGPRTMRLEPIPRGILDGRGVASSKRYVPPFSGERRLGKKVATAMVRGASGMGTMSFAYLFPYSLWIGNGMSMSLANVARVTRTIVGAPRRATY